MKGKVPAYYEKWVLFSGSYETDSMNKKRLNFVQKKIPKIGMQNFT